ncbi:MAG: type I glutamate--ammonia ligase, partial [Lachnospiraceae bacterium]|nr:type I glutamate--ammonia ligase [Lachnospiraceae bacterium]
LVMAACLSAGLEGMKQKLEPPVSMNDGMGNEADAEKLPRTLHEAVKLFKKDVFLQRAIGKHISEHLIHTKDEEWDAYCKQVTGWEMEQYLRQI